MHGYEQNDGKWRMDVKAEMINIYIKILMNIMINNYEWYDNNN